MREKECASYSPPLVIPAKAGIYPNRSPIGSGMTTFSWIGLRAPLEIIRERIEFRVRDRLGLGAIDEVKKLIEEYPDKNLPIYTTLGIKPIIKFINKEIDLTALVNTWVTDEVNYAKRQITWFKKQPDILWYDE